MITTPRRAARQSVSLFAALGVGVALAACGHSGQDQPAASPSAQSLSAPATALAAPAADNDVSRIGNVKDDFPQGFTAESHPAKTLDQQDIDHSGINSFTGAQFDPAQCRSAIIPAYAQPSVGTNAAGVRGQGDQGNIYAVAMRLPQPVPSSPPPAGCDEVTMSGDPQASGTAEPVPAPNIAGVTTTGAELSTDDDDDPDYIYTAALDDHTTVVVMGNMDEQLNPRQYLSDLLVKSVAAVRGQ
ncbi:MAG TPA: DUF5642 family protein [Mycobacterium sp.]